MEYLTAAHNISSIVRIQKVFFARNALCLGCNLERSTVDPVPPSGPGKRCVTCQSMMVALESWLKWTAWKSHPLKCLQPLWDVPVYHNALASIHNMEVHIHHFLIALLSHSFLLDSLHNLTKVSALLSPGDTPQAGQKRDFPTLEVHVCSTASRSICSSSLQGAIQLLAILRCGVVTTTGTPQSSPSHRAKRTWHHIV